MKRNVLAFIITAVLFVTGRSTLVAFDFIDYRKSVGGFWDILVFLLILGVVESLINLIHKKKTIKESQDAPIQFEDVQEQNASYESLSSEDNDTSERKLEPSEETNSGNTLTVEYVHVPKNKRNEPLKQGEKSKQGKKKGLKIAFLSLVGLLLVGFFVIYFANKKNEDQQESLFIEAKQLMNNGKTAEATRLLKILCKKDNVDALYYYGGELYSGARVKQNRKKGLELYEKAGDLNDERSLRLLAKLYKADASTVQKAIEKYDKLISLGDDSLYTVVSSLYYQQSINYKDNPIFNIEKAKQYAKMGYDHNNKNAAHILGSISFEEERYNEAMSFLLNALEKNPKDKYAAKTVAEMYELGLGVSVDEKRAYEYYKIASDLGDMESFKKTLELYVWSRDFFKK